MTPRAPLAADAPSAEADAANRAWLADASSAPLRVELAIVLLLAIYCALPFILHDQPTSLASVEQAGLKSPGGDGRKQVLLLMMYAGLALATLRYLDRRVLRATSVPMIALLCLAFASCLWSELPALASRRAVALAGTVLFGVFLALRVPPARLAVLTNVLAVAVLTASFLVAIVLPAAGLDAEGRLRGVFAHKNGLGMFAALAVLSGLSAIIQPPRTGRGRLPWLVLALAGAALAGAHSASPLVAVLFGACVQVLFALRLRRSPHRLTTIVCSVLLLVMVCIPFLGKHVGALGALFDRSATFSGRTGVWEYGLAFLAHRPLLGFGYTSFWPGTPGLLYARMAHYPVPHSHNGALQTLLGTGVVGLALVLWLLTRAIRRLHAILNRSKRSPSAWLAGFLVLYLSANIAESSLFEPNDLYTTFFAYAVVRINLTYASLTAGHTARTPSRRPGKHQAGSNGTVKDRNRA